MATKIEISDDSIGGVLDAFYARVRKDPLLAPVFASAIPDEAWPAHLAIINDFWTSLMLKTGRYRRNPFAAHAKLTGLTPEMFDRWIALFATTCREKMPEEAAEAMISKAMLVRDSLVAGLFFRPGKAPNTV